VSSVLVSSGSCLMGADWGVDYVHRGSASTSPLRRTTTSCLRSCLGIWSAKRCGRISCGLGKDQSKLR
jgi:hypothetical protein